MKKFLAAFIALLITAASASATLYPRNTQFAEMENGWYAKVDFDYFDGDSAPGVDADLANLLELDVRHTFADRYRIGMSIPLSYGSRESNTPGAPVNTSNFGFGNIGLSLEYAVSDNFTAFFNQKFPTSPSGSIGGSDFVLANGGDSYILETGGEFQFQLFDNVTWFSEIGYRYDDNAGGPGLLFNNAWIMDRGDSWFNPSLELTGISHYDSNVTDLRLIPGWITPLGGDHAKQFRIGFPIGLNRPDSIDFGVQAGFFLSSN